MNTIKKKEKPASAVPQSMTKTKNSTQILH